MKKLVAFLGLLFLFSVNGLSQLERVDIIENKIKSIKKTFYENEDSIHKENFQNFYSTKGDDSLELYNGRLSSKYVAELDEKGRVAKLIRYDEKVREDELHMYKYNHDGSYTIEKIAQGAGTISIARYDKRNWLMEEEIESSYSMIYQRNAMGKTTKILLKGKDKNSEVIAVFYFDKKGWAIKGEGTTEGGKTVYFKYNEKGLASEIRTISKEQKGKEQVETVLLEYEFY